MGRNKKILQALPQSSFKKNYGKLMPVRSRVHFFAAQRRKTPPGPTTQAASLQPPSDGLQPRSERFHCVARKNPFTGLACFRANRVGDVSLVLITSSDGPIGPIFSFRFTSPIGDSLLQHFRLTAMVQPTGETCYAMLIYACYVPTKPRSEAIEGHSSATSWRMRTHMEAQRKHTRKQGQTWGHRPQRHTEAGPKPHKARERTRRPDHGTPLLTPA